MKKVMSILLVFVLSVSLACTAFAAETFVPSIGEKPAPELVEDANGNVGAIVDANGNVIDDVHSSCLVVTAVSRMHQAPDVLDEEMDLLGRVYRALSSGEMKIPAEKLHEGLTSEEVVVRDLFDLSWTCEEHAALLEQDNYYLRLNFSAEVADEFMFFVMTYKQEEWNPITAVQVNEDNTVTCTFAHLCPVAFIYGADEDIPNTGSMIGKDMILWVAVMAVSTVALVAVVVDYRKKKA